MQEYISAWKSPVILTDYWAFSFIKITIDTHFNGYTVGIFTLLNLFF